jgi:hypothetical protein
MPVIAFLRGMPSLFPKDSPPISVSLIFKSGESEELAVIVRKCLGALCGRIENGSLEDRGVSICHAV